MCGITGFWDPNHKTTDHASVIKNMTKTLNHRGPDSNGTWVNSQSGAAFGHTRLAIQDLSVHGHQPMVTNDESYALTYNGEIYNADDVRKELLAKGISFNGSSDTEVLLHACITWGVKEAVQKMIGMFAFAFFDKRSQTTSLVRDRIGIKPLYYGIMGKQLVFGSELKPFHAHPAMDKTINRRALNHMLNHMAIPAPLSIFEKINHIEPATILTFDRDLNITKDIFWSLNTSPSQLSYDDAKSQLNDLLIDSVSRRLISDVPIGTFLSGGVDSSLITAIAQSISDKPIQTFSIGFDEMGFNEAPFAKDIASHLNTNHTEFYVGSKDALEVIPQLSTMFDEPFADSSQIPTYLLSKLARDHVTVCLSGDGGDELFAGYSRYQKIMRLEKYFKNITSITSRLPHINYGGRMGKLHDYLSQNNITGRYNAYNALWPLKENLIEGYIHSSNNNSSDFSTLMALQHDDLHHALPDDILTKVDRASMAIALEARVPVLDHRIADFAFALPDHYKVKGSEQKMILRDVLYDYVPCELIDRPKQGFALPISDWLRTDLRDWAENLLQHEKLEQNGLNPKPILKRWNAHKNGNKNYHHSLWGVLMWQAWAEEWL